MPRERNSALNNAILIITLISGLENGKMMKNWCKSNQEIFA